MGKGAPEAAAAPVLPADSGGGVVGREERGDGAWAVGWAFGPVGAGAFFLKGSAENIA